MSKKAMELGEVPPLRASSGISGKTIFVLILIVGVIFGAALAAYMWKTWQEGREQESHDSVGQEKKQASALPSDTAPLPDDLQAAIAKDLPLRGDEPAGDPADAADPAEGYENGVSAAPGSAAAAGPAPALTEAQQAELDLRERRIRAPVLAFSSQGAPGAMAGQKAPAAAPVSEEDMYMQAVNAALKASAGAGGGAGAKGLDSDAPPSLASQLQGDKFAAATASMMLDQNFTMPQGTVARCVLKTAFNSQLSGFASCQLSEPVYSANGRFVLLEAGSEVVGTYQTGQIKAGMKRAFVLWNTVRTPYGVRIDLDSPAADGMGRTGINGKVNNHFWQRFGSAMLVSLVDDVARFATSKQSGGENTNISFGSTAESSRDAASIIVENSVNIPPTLSAEAGAVVNIFVARDLNFASVYGFKLQNGSGTKQ
ncbi:type IV secretion system protein VirB10 [Stenotrophomonas sp. PvP093]|uniref:type IV secretion system protein VirB10 n=1 Tax=unclassified Stenotrophomonas TaxID=196198 RepID=UPI001AE1E322|nr:type IV secretion system protein VirB10 [Stenotrophomonas sp. PvP093]MBP2480134.1 type IV secretion system protein VirB10 [Stenotrophomonas sp. PvP093]